MNNIAIFASGNGTNAENIIKYFSTNSKINISLIVTNVKNAGVIERAEKLGVSVLYMSKEEINSSKIIDILKYHKISFIALAGYLLKIPQILLKAYPGKIINLHPALLPKYGGKGMYGIRVHESVINSKETESGITIHIIDENFDQGEIVFQAKCKVCSNDTPESLACKIHTLEYKYYPQIIEKIIHKYVF